MSPNRLRPRFWRHDAYALGKLAQSIAGFSERLQYGRSRGLDVVDFGAGDAPYRPLFSSESGKYVCCDLGRDAQVEIVPGAPLSLQAAEADLVLSIQVLEHVWDIDWYLAEARRLLREDGWLLLSTHGVWPYHPHPTDFRRWTREGLLGELARHGFEAVQVDALLGPMAWTTQVRALGYHAVLAKVPGVGRLLSGLLCGFLNLRMHVEDRVTPKPWIESNAAIYVILARVSNRAVGLSGT